MTCVFWNNFNMNILIPDSWLRDYLKTKATPAQLKEYLSLCGPSIERVNHVGKETVYDIEITTNRIDSMSVYGVAREAHAILPRFDIKTELLPIDTATLHFPKTALGITITDEKKYCRRILAVKISNITLGPSPAWFSKRLELVGQRSINNIVDITNYVMWETGHPVHAFDYDRLLQKKIIVREARKGEIVISLDEKKHTMVGGELIFDDGTGTIIDIPGIMGTSNTVVTPQTKNVLLFIENSIPEKIRFTSMTHAIRTNAAVINEKDPDSELALIAMQKAIGYALEFTKGTLGSTLYDAYPVKPEARTVSVSRKKLDSYMGISLPPTEITRALTSLGFETTVSKDDVTVVCPTFRKDVEIDVDIIEEVARIHGYHAVVSTLPEKTPPPVIPDPALAVETFIKNRLRDWGYTEIYGYSMISESELTRLGFSPSQTYKISNPLSDEWVYMRPSLLTTMLPILKQNLSHKKVLQLFELSMTYRWQNGLPQERPMLMIAWTGNEFLQAKGVGETLLKLFGIAYEETHSASDPHYSDVHLALGEFGHVGVLNSAILAGFDIVLPVTILELDLNRIVSNQKPDRTYTPIPKYPPAIEDLAFIVPDNFSVGPFMKALKNVHPLIKTVTFLDSHEQTRTVRIEYLDQTKNLVAEDIRPVREKLITIAKQSFLAELKGL